MNGMDYTRRASSYLQLRAAARRFLFLFEIRFGFFGEVREHIPDFLYLRGKT